MNMLLMKIKYSEHKMDGMWRLEMLLVQQGGKPNAHAFWIYGTVELKMNTGFVSDNRKEMSLQLEKRIFLVNV